MLGLYVLDRLSLAVLYLYLQVSVPVRFQPYTSSNQTVSSASIMRIISQRQAATASISED